MDEICRKCGAQTNELRYCAPQSRQLGCFDSGEHEHMHVVCVRCRAPIRTRPTDDA